MYNQITKLDFNGSTMMVKITLTVNLTLNGKLNINTVI